MSSVQLEVGIPSSNPILAPRQPLSAWQGVLIAAGLLLLVICISYVGGEAAKPLLTLAVLGTSLWASIDTYRIRQRYKAKDTTPDPIGLFLFLLFIWIVMFPIYLVKRSRVLAMLASPQGVAPAEPLPQNPQADHPPTRSGKTVLVAGLSVILLGSLTA